MEDSEFNQDKFQTLRTLFAEIAEMQNQLNEKYKTKVELENELVQRKRIEDESRVVKASLEEQLANSNAEKERVKEELEREIQERKRIEEEFRTVKASLEEQLAKRESEMELITNNLKNERQTMREALDSLQQKFNTLYKL